MGHGIFTYMYISLILWVMAVIASDLWRVETLVGRV